MGKIIKYNVVSEDFKASKYDNYSKQRTNSNQLFDAAALEETKPRAGYLDFKEKILSKSNSADSCPFKDSFSSYSSSPCTRIVFRPYDNKLVVTTDWSGMVNLYSYTGKKLGVLNYHDQNFVHSVGFCLQEGKHNRFATCADDGRIAI